MQISLLAQLVSKIQLACCCPTLSHGNHRCWFLGGQCPQLKSQLEKDVAREPKVSRQQIEPIECYWLHILSRCCVHGTYYRDSWLLFYTHLLRWQHALLFCIWISTHGRDRLPGYDRCLQINTSVPSFSSCVSSGGHRPCKTWCTPVECHLPDDMATWEWD